MTRGLYPPETLSKDDIRTLASVRREIWTNAIIGGGKSLVCCLYEDPFSL